MVLPLVDINQLSGGLGSKPALQNIDLTINRNQHWCVSGPINSGKTTLLKLIMGQGRIFHGQISYPFFYSDGASYDRYKAIKLVSFTDNSHLFHNANAVHYYQQRYHATESEGHLTVGEYLKSGGLDWTNNWHLEVLEFFKLNKLLTYERIKLSSGQTRKMLLARVLLSSPLLLLLDQPYMGMDGGSRSSFNELLDQLVERFGITLVIAADHDHLPHCIKYHLHLENGTGSVFEHTANPSISTTLDIAVPPKIVELYKDGSKEPDYARAVRCSNVQVQYGQRRILSNFNWEVKAGQKWALNGPNGVGKSTLLALLYGDHPQAYANEIYLFDRRRGSGESIWDIKKRTGFTSSEVHAFFRAGQTATQLILTGLNDKWVYHGQTNPFSEIIIPELLTYFDLQEFWDQPFQLLSTGTQRLLFFIRALIKIPNLLLLDEPFQGLDLVSMHKAKHLLTALLDERHNLIFISHYDAEIPTIVDHRLSLTLTPD